MVEKPDDYHRKFVRGDGVREPDREAYGPANLYLMPAREWGGRNRHILATHPYQPTLNPIEMVFANVKGSVMHVERRTGCSAMMTSCLRDQLVTAAAM